MKRFVISLIFVVGMLAYSAPIRSAIGARNISVSEGESISYTAADYIQDGLISLWDGIENSDWGTHDDSIAYWSDLIGGRRLETTGTSWSWMNDSLLTENCGFTIGLSDVACLRSTFTIEYVGTAISLRYAAYLWGMTANYNSYNRYAGVGTAITLYYNVMCNGRANNAGFTSTGVQWHNGDHVCITVVYKMGDGLCHIYMNGEYLTDGISDGYVVPSSSVGHKLVIGGAGQSTDTVPSLRTHCVRIYSRTLSPEEIKENYVVDKARFDLP